MEYQAIVELLGFAAGHERLVRITTDDDHEVVGIPTGVDTGRGASEVFLHPIGDDDTEIVIALPRIRAVELT